jgi:hypothetical protein
MELRFADEAHICATRPGHRADFMLGGILTVR